MNQRGFSVIEFAISVVSFASGLYFIFWACYLGSNYSLARYYLDDFLFCEMKAHPKECWQSLKRRVDSLKFVEVRQLSTNILGQTKTAILVFNYSLPIFGLSQGITNIKLTASQQIGKWQ
ncbi:MAG: hypothetical protein JNL11_14085 [Bdellovibrionaceae bacterium]|nr:hypothetical protein [Pseudobdellovibrionaceae bacterium]